MADDADKAQESMDKEFADAIANIIGAELPEGKPGDCDICGEWSGRTVQGACSPCRDRHNLP